MEGLAQRRVLYWRALSSKILLSIKIKNMIKFKYVFLFLVLGLLTGPFITKAYTFQKDLNIGSKGTDVTELQKYLVLNGYLDSKYITGTFGKLTLTAVQKLQKNSKFVSTSGAFGPKTRVLLNNLQKNDSVSSIIKSNLESFLATANYKPTISGNISSCSSVLYGYENNRAYAWVYCGEYDKNFKLGPASSIAVSAEYDSSYKVISVYESSEDGSSSAKDKQFFGKFYNTLALGHPSNQDIMTLSQEALSKAKSSAARGLNSSVKILSPNGDETYTAGQHTTIKWEASTSFSSLYPKVLITLVAGSAGQAVVPSQEMIVANTGSTDWIVPTVSLNAYVQDYSGGPYTLRSVNNQMQFKFLISGYPNITGRSEGPIDYSDNYFKISSSDTSSVYDAFATCVKNSGAIFYGTFWCPHCQATKDLFGTSASLLPYVECSTADGKGQTQICTDKKIQGYPTWIFADGTTLSGEQSLSTLANKTSCNLPQ